MSFDPQTERDKKAMAAAAKVVKPRLDPKFPWRAIAFDPFTFGVDRDPPEPPKKK